MTSTSHVHPKDCPDHKAADADRKQHEERRMRCQERQQALAHAAWFEWYAPPPGTQPQTSSFDKKDSAPISPASRTHVQ